MKQSSVVGIWAGEKLKHFYIFTCETFKEVSPHDAGSGVMSRGSVLEIKHNNNAHQMHIPDISTREALSKQ